MTHHPRPTPQRSGSAAAKPPFRWVLTDHAIARVTPPAPSHPVDRLRALGAEGYVDRCKRCGAGRVHHLDAGLWRCECGASRPTRRPMGRRGLLITAGTALIVCGALAWLSSARSLLRASAELGTVAYVGSEACTACHDDRHASWQRTFHRTMTQDASASKVQTAMPSGLRFIAITPCRSMAPSSRFPLPGCANAA